MRILEWGVSHDDAAYDAILNGCAQQTPMHQAMPAQF